MNLFNESRELQESNEKNPTDGLAGGPIETCKNRNEQDQRRINKFKEKRKNPRPPSFSYVETTDSMMPANNDEKFLRVELSEAFGTVNLALQDILLSQISGTSPREYSSKVKNLNASLAILHGVKPKDELEGLLAAQMVGVHNLAMEFMRRAMLPDQTIEGVNSNADRATKMLRTYTSQLEALNRYRGKTQQRVTVEHVTVNEGGSAIVGQVNQTKAGHSGEGE